MRPTRWLCVALGLLLIAAGRPVAAQQTQGVRGETVGAAVCLPCEALPGPLPAELQPSPDSEAADHVPSWAPVAAVVVGAVVGAVVFSAMCREPASCEMQDLFGPIVGALVAYTIIMLPHISPAAPPW